MYVNLAPPADYALKEAAARRQFAALLHRGEKVALVKNIKHTWKDSRVRPNLDLRFFNKVLSVDTDERLVEVEGMATFYDLVAATLPLGLMPQAVPEMRSITVGGAIAGLGGQSSSFRYGLIHEMVTDFDLLTGEGRVLHCSPHENADIFYMLPNSYGSLGYVLRCRLRLNRVRPYVHLVYDRFTERADFFAALAERVQAGVLDFLEGVSFSPRQFILLSGEFVEAPPPDQAPFNPLHDPFFLSARDEQTRETWLTIEDYIWRWDPDAFFATDQQNIFGALLLNRRFRRLVGGMVLRSDRLIKIGKLRNRLRKMGAARLLFQEGGRREALIQDAAIPVARAAEFDAWLAQTLSIYPLWYCPVKTTHEIGTFPLYRPGSEIVVDFGFYCSMDLEAGMEDYHYNRAIEAKLVNLGGIKCLYSDTFFDEALFWSLYDREAYSRVKERVDPAGTFLGLYEKVVNGERGAGGSGGREARSEGRGRGRGRGAGGSN